MSKLYEDAIERLRKYAYQRDRMHDHEVRTISITDDEAMSLLGYISHLTGEATVKKGTV